MEAYRGKQVIAGIRPEYFHNKTQQDDEYMTIHTEIQELTGADLLVHTELNRTPVICRCHPGSIESGSHKMEVGINVQRIVFFDPDTGSRI
ncbi:MAG: hypothetical protein GKR96_12285 [Gammaproteobacteria bacterium]|nr:hypothetical protein [Gammaproteobacteria bacterium]